jgi:hypothetical protein
MLIAYAPVVGDTNRSSIRMGLSAERVRQIEERALGKLRDSVAA